MTIVGEIKDVASVLQKAGNIELYGKLIDVQAKIIELLDRDVELKEENLKLKRALETDKIVLFKNDAYWIESDNPSEAGPYCSKCYDVEHKLVHLIDDSGYHYLLQCPSCKTTMNRVAVLKK